MATRLKLNRVRRVYTLLLPLVAVAFVSIWAESSEQALVAAAPDYGFVRLISLFLSIALLITGLGLSLITVRDTRPKFLSETISIARAKSWIVAGLGLLVILWIAYWVGAGFGLHRG